MNNVKEIRFEYVVKYVWFEVVDIYIFVGISVEYSNVKFNCCQCLLSIVKISDIELVCVNIIVFIEFVECVFILIIGNYLIIVVCSFYC